MLRVTVGDNHAVPLGCTVYGKSLTIRRVDVISLSFSIAPSLYLNLLYRHAGGEFNNSRETQHINPDNII